MCETHYCCSCVISQLLSGIVSVVDLACSSALGPDLRSLAQSSLLLGYSKCRNSVISIYIVQLQS